MTDEPASDATSVRAAYDTVAGLYAEHFPGTGPESPLDLAVLDHFVACLAAEGGGPVLDAGCGTGRITRYLADRGCSVQGVDLSPGMLAMARRDHPDLEFGTAALTALPFPDGHFAGVLLWYSIIHTPLAEHTRVLAEAVRVLRPGGFLCLGFQSGDGTRDVAPAYRAYGLEVELERYLTTADRIAAAGAELGLSDVCRMVRRGVGDASGLRDQQTSMVLSLTGPGA